MRTVDETCGSNRDRPPSADTPVGARLHDWVRGEIAAATKALAARGGRIHAGVHRARKSIRRTRAALRLARSALGVGADIVERELRHVNRTLAVLRDAHALVVVLDRLSVKARDPDDALLMRRASRIAAARRAALAREPSQVMVLGDARDTLAMLSAALSGLPWDRLEDAVLADALGATGQRAAGLRDKAVRSGLDKDWHAWRRWMRRQSQQRRACARIGVEAPDTGFDKSLTEQLGVMQDLSLLIEHCGRGSPFAKPDRRRLRRFARAKLDRQRERIVSVTQPPAPEPADPQGDGPA